MIPRLKPDFGISELTAVLKCHNTRIADFECAFAGKFESKYALFFPYGRTGLYCLFKAFGLENAQIIMPAYTCVVVAHAVVLSGNIPKFVDVKLPDFNMDLDQVDKAINEKTGAIVATHLFGYPLDVDKLKDIVRKHEKRLGTKIYIINDCAHSFGAKFQGKLVCNEGDAAVFALNISKVISAIFGGMVTTNDEELFYKLLKVRQEVCIKPNVLKEIKRVLYFLSTYPTFQKNIYGLVNFIEENTKFIDKFTKYYDESKIDFPVDWRETIGRVEAIVGLAQLKKYDGIISGRVRNAQSYYHKLQKLKSNIMKLPPITEGATFSHFVSIVENRQEIIQYMRKQKIQLGNLIEYSIPDMMAYQKYKMDKYPISQYCSEHTINLPIYRDCDVNKVCQKIEDYITLRPG